MSFKGITVMVPEENLGNITAADDAAIFQSLIGSDGVLSIGNKFAVTVISNNDVRVSDGVLCVGGHMGRISYGDYNDMTIENGILGENRNDIIYAKFLISGNYDTFTLEVKKGDSVAGTANDPALTQGVLYENATLREFPLWRVKLEGLSIVAVEQMFTLVPTIPELEAKFNELNSNLNGIDISHTVTALATFRIDSIDLKLRGNHVSGNIVVSLQSGGVFHDSYVLQIPKEYAPKFITQITANGYLNSDTKYLPGYGFINTDGKVCFYSDNATNINIAYISFSYDI